MNIGNIRENLPKGKSDTYEHFLAIDWSMKVMAVAHMTRRSKEPKMFERPSNLQELKAYIDSLNGRKVLAIEETNLAFLSHERFYQMKNDMPDIYSHILLNLAKEFSSRLRTMDNKYIKLLGFFF